MSEIRSLTPKREARDSVAAYRERILAAAEDAFIRGGFHQTTMQDIARAAQMSPGNIYRYFKSKEALVFGLIEQGLYQTTQPAIDFEKAADPRAAILYIIRSRYIEIGATRARLRLEIWAEMARNPALVEFQRDMLSERRDWIMRLLTTLADRPAFDAAKLYATIDLLLKGIVLNMALVPGYDPEPAYAHVLMLIDQGVSGAGGSSTHI
jgi:TetR/AcrR family transcriptional repressor of uid operon